MLDTHSSTRIIWTKLQTVLIQKKKSNQNHHGRNDLCGWQQPSRIGWLVFVYLPYFPHAPFLLASFTEDVESEELLPQK